MLLLVVEAEEKLKLKWQSAIPTPLCFPERACYKERCEGQNFADTVNLTARGSFGWVWMSSKPSLGSPWRREV